VPQPLEHVNKLMVIELGTQSGCLKWHSEMANAEYDTYVGKILGILQDTDFFVSLGFRMEADGSHGVDYADEKELTLLIMDLARESMASELQPMRVFSERPPFKFAALHHEDPRVQQECCNLHGYP
jgi:hypothetical protein